MALLICSLFILLYVQSINESIIHTNLSILTINLKVLFDDKVNKRGHVAGFESLTRQLSRQRGFANTLGAEKQELLPAIRRRTIEGVPVVDQRIRRRRRRHRGR